jgi:hypothetical protein
VLAEPFGRAQLHHRQRLRLPVVAGENELDDVVRHVGKQRVAPRARKLVRSNGFLEQDLDVDLPIGRVHAARVVDEVGVDAAPVLGILDPAALSETQVAAFADDAAPELAAVDAHGVVGGIGRIRVRFDARFYVGADTAVPQQVDPRRENGAD